MISRIPADAAAASCPMGEEHVLAIIEHIICTCTPVAKFHALHHVVLWTFAVGGWNVCSAAGMEAKHKEVRIAALRVNDRDNTQYDTGRQVCALIHEWAIQIQSMIA